MEQEKVIGKRRRNRSAGALTNRKRTNEAKFERKVRIEKNILK
jgi:hypothetical protein